MSFDSVVVGAGVVGLACAERLARKGHSVLVLERNDAWGRETSSRNSQVIHAGMYYPTGSLKASTCVEGRRRLVQWCQTHGVPHKMVGKYIVATHSDEEEALDAIRRQGERNGVEGLQWVSGSRLRERVPEVVGTAALWSPHTGIVDAHALMASLVASARSPGPRGGGCDLAFRHRLVAAHRETRGYRLSIRGPDAELSELSVRWVINAAGLESDTVAALPGLDVDQAGYRLRYVKGSYARIRGASPVGHLIYPIPPKNLMGLGIHLTVELDGRARLGPDVEPLPNRSVDYDVPESLVESFHRAAQRYLPGLEKERVVPDTSGIRPRLARPQGAVADFIVAEESARGLEGWVNLVGIESPGLTASLALAEAVSERV